MTADERSPAAPIVASKAVRVPSPFVVWPK